MLRGAPRGRAHLHLSVRESRVDAQGKRNADEAFPAAQSDFLPRSCFERRDQRYNARFREIHELDGLAAVLQHLFVDEVARFERASQAFELLRRKRGQKAIARCVGNLG